MRNTCNELISFVENIKELNHCTAASLMIQQDGEIILEHYSGTHSRAPHAPVISAGSQFNVASARKSYLGLSVAYAIYEGKVKLDDCISDYLEGYDKDLLDKTTIRHLCTHSHGLKEQRDGSVIREFKPGEGWAYRRINTTMICELIQHLYGKPFTQLIKERVLFPLDLTETGWYTEEQENLVKVIVEPELPEISRVGKSKEGSESNLFVSTRDFIRWGELHLNRGYMNGKQVVPEEVIELATSIQSPTYQDLSLPLNGLFWYVQGSPAAMSELGERVPEGSYQILGITGPTILVIPHYKVVVAKMYNKEKNYGGREYLKFIKEFSNKAADLFL
ncbi:serine hydrolase domain-containing protein [Bacillus pinisoli]|uniref:serine hydrolase domain-containing protein n=1 Tax=Bacillus pinisoli TaxID=2901866 RepID=UPI001FF24E16|nr:serine hydrolase domain-containing protein [Bacillus pinisoli]